MIEGISEDTAASSTSKEKDPKSKDKDSKKLGKESLGLLGKVEASHKEETARKIFDSSMWEEIIPKAGKESKSDERSTEVFPVIPPTAEKPEAAEKIVEPITSEVMLQADAETAAGEAEEADDPEVETVSAEELPEVVKQVASGRAAELEAERPADEAPDEAAGRDAAIAELQNFAEHPEDLALEVPDASSEAVDAAEQNETDQPEASEPTELEHGQEIPLNSAETTVPIPVTPAGPSSAQPGSPNTAPTSPNTPPASPGGPGTPGGPGGPGRPGGPTTPGGPGGGANFNAMPAGGFGASSPNAINVAGPTTTVEQHYYQENTGSYFLAGAILGFLYGRRRGRIKTEKRLRAVSKKLEKQVSDVRQQVLAQEAVIRRQARDRYNETHQPASQRSEARGAETTAARTVNPSLQTERASRPASAPEQRSPAASREQPFHLSAPEKAANQRQAAERLGVNPAVAAATAERVQTMDHREILGIAEKVVVDGTSLRTIYEAKQITEPGLRRITREFLRGGDVKAALRAELQVKEMQYERDPLLRDRLAASYDSVNAAQPQAASEGMAALLAQNDAPKTSGMHSSVQEAAEEAEAAKKKHQQTLVNAWTAFAVLLAIIAVILLIR